MKGAVEITLTLIKFHAKEVNRHRKCKNDTVTECLRIFCDELMDFNERTQKFQNLERKVINVEPNELKVMPTEPPPQVYSTVPFNFPAIATAGIAVNGALAINQAVAMSQVRINEYIEKKRIDFYFKQQEEFLKHSQVTVNGIPIVKIPIDFEGLENQFVETFLIVKIRSNISREGHLYMIHDLENFKHVPIEQSELYLKWETFVWDKINDDQECEESKIKRHFRRVLQKIVFLEKSNLTKLDDIQLMFTNGYYDLRRGLLLPLVPGEKYFNRFSMLCEFHPDDREPVVFHAMLADMFDNNVELMNLAYEFIGAILFPVSTLKKIYVFQGVSNGGKSRLANVIVKLLSERDVRIFNGLEGINSEFLKKEAPFCRLVYIRDAADKKMASIPCSNLKGFADGSDLNDSAAFKILICTNNRLATGADGYLPPSLVNRFAVLPFPKPMDNIDENIVNFENYHFEREKNQILNKAFRAFQKVFFNKGIFSTAVTINNCVETNEVQNEQTTDKVFSKLDYILNLLFVTTDQPDTRMTTANMISAINHLDPSIEISPETLGRVLKKYFGENLKPSRNSSGIYYNLAFKTFPT